MVAYFVILKTFFSPHIWYVSVKLIFILKFLITYKNKLWQSVLLLNTRLEAFYISHPEFQSINQTNMTIVV